MAKLPRNQLDDEVEAKLARLPWRMKRDLLHLGQAAAGASADERKEVREFFTRIAEHKGVTPAVAEMAGRVAKIVGAVEHYTKVNRIQRHFRGHGRASGDASDPRLGDGGPK